MASSPADPYIDLPALPDDALPTDVSASSILAPILASTSIDYIKKQPGDHPHSERSLLVVQTAFVQQAIVELLLYAHGHGGWVRP